jgi:hypothetical protein
MNGYISYCNIGNKFISPMNDFFLYKKAFFVY